MIESTIAAAGQLFSWPVIGWAVVGIIVGIIGGALPGLGASVTMVIFLPFTATLDPSSALIMLIGIYAGTHYGGSIAAILINVPGTAGSAATTIEGYPMTKDGLALKALTISAISTGISGIVIGVSLFVITPAIIFIVLLFGSPDFFLMAVLGLAMIVVVTKGSLVKGLVAGALGVLYSTIGRAPAHPQVRYTFGRIELLDGLSFIAALIGLFAIAEMLVLSKRKSISEGGLEVAGKRSEGIKEIFNNPIILLKSSFIGGLVGSLPGAGASAANFVAYAEEVRRGDKEDLDYGSGEPTGVIATEASNSGTVGGALIPTLSFGIPGSAATAVLLGGMLIHGIRPGPDMFGESIEVTFLMYAMVILSGILIIVFGLLFVTQVSYITKVNTHVIIPGVIAFSLIGGFMLNENWFDLAFGVVILGFLGYYFKAYNYSVISFVLGAILGPIAEENLIRSLALSDGSWFIFVSEPLSIMLLLGIVFVILSPFINAGRIRSIKERLLN